MYIKKLDNFFPLTIVQTNISFCWLSLVETKKINYKGIFHE